jgi:hypothetical protein
MLANRDWRVDQMKGEPEPLAPLEEFTPAPWRWEVNLKSRTIRLCGGVPRYDLTVMDFVRWGMGGAAPRLRGLSGPRLNIMYRIEHFARVVLGREHHSDWFRFIDHPDARLMEASPELLLHLESWIDGCATCGGERGGNGIIDANGVYCPQCNHSRKLVERIRGTKS